ncbi:sulfur reductase DrsE [Alicyclobacillaceae bacterium I2511]|nr:sulfur reductase DrsE [Alicyclobacillaceae bacterium I2511]
MAEKSVLITLTTGKEIFVRTMAVLQLTLSMAQQEMDMEFLALGPGVEVLRSNQRNSAQFGEMLDKMRNAGVNIKVCQMSLENIGLTQDQMFPADIVMGGIEIARCIKTGYTVLTF